MPGDKAILITGGIGRFRKIIKIVLERNNAPHDHGDIIERINLSHVH